MTQRNALLAIHLGALLFGLSGIFGKLAATAPLNIVGGRALFAVLALALFARLFGQAGGPRPSVRQLGLLVLGGLLLGSHWLSFFEAVNVSGVAIATLGFASFPAFTLLLEGLLFRERTRPSEFALVGLVSLGLVLVTPQFDLGSQATIRPAVGVLSGCCSPCCHCSTVPASAAWTRCRRHFARTSRYCCASCQPPGRCCQR